MEESSCCGYGVTETENNDGFGRCKKCGEHCTVINTELLDEKTAFEEAMHWKAVNETTKQICNGVTRLMNFIFDKPRDLNIIK